jgi:hypothetical protein
MTNHDPAMVGDSGYERNENEKYYTQPWCTRTLVTRLPDYVSQRRVWEPACGRGDITGVLHDFGIDVFNSDIDLSEFNTDYGTAKLIDFIKEPLNFGWCEEYSAIITNPPYGGESVEYEGRKVTPAEAFVRKSLDTGIDFVAMFLRSEFNAAGGRTDLFNAESPFAYEIVMTKRPRWDDWWNGKPPKASPRHNFSWFVWDRNWTGVSTQFWEGEKNG